MNDVNWNELLEKAIIIATNAHAGILDKGGNPYILHPLSVMMKLTNVKEQITAVLHDVVEDKHNTFDDLREAGFPEEIIDAVDSVSRRPDESYFDFVRRAKENAIGKVVKEADILDNLNISRISNPTKKDYDRLKKYEEALNILKS